jgi:predicted Zn-dependent protease
MQPRFGFSTEDVYLIAARAHALYEQGRPKEAAVLLEGLVAVVPENSYCREALAAVYLSRGEPGRAIEQLTAALNVNPESAETLARRCEAYLDAGDLPRALADLALLRTHGGAGQVGRLEARVAAQTRPAAPGSGSQLPEPQHDN